MSFGKKRLHLTFPVQTFPDALMNAFPPFPTRTAMTLLMVAACLTRVARPSPPPAEPLNIGSMPQFFLDDFVVDNRWALKQKREAVLRVFHAPVKHPANPLIADDGGFVCVAKDEQAGRLRMWYQTHAWTGNDADDESRTLYAIAYAESNDGLTWERPNLGLHDWKGSKANNIVWTGLMNSRASGHQILRLPDADRRGFRFVMTYRTAAAKRGHNGIRVIGSPDGIHWDERSDTLIHPLPSDTVNSIVHDSARGEYVMFCRPKDRYRLFQGDIVETGESRRIARMSNATLWEEWKASPQTILTPDEFDARENFNAFYGMPARYHAGIYWGALWCFRFNDHIFTELAFSRDGFQFERLPERPKMIALGEEGSWDDSMAFGSADWVEMGDQWWFYYSGWDGDHGARQRRPGIGLATLRREGLVSLRGPTGGGVVVTRLLKWPGGRLLINADAAHGEIKVRVSDATRKIIPGFDYADCEAFAGDATAHEVKWHGQSLDVLARRALRLEFLLTQADLYTFRADPPS